MRHAARLPAYLLLGLVALLAVGLLAINLYVQSHATQTWIEEEIGARLGARIKIQRISLTPWWGLKLKGITIPQEDPEDPGAFLRAEAFRLRVNWSALFTGQLVIKEVALIRPRVTWMQNANGKWRLPETLPGEPVERERSAAQPLPPAATSSPPVAPAPGQSSLPPERARFTPEVRRVRLTNGTFRFLDERRKPVATFDGVRFRSDFRNATALNGHAMVERISLRDRFFLEDLRSRLSYDPTQLDLTEIAAEAAGGNITGRFTMRQAETGSPFHVLVNFSGLDANRVLSDARGPSGMVQGKLEGRLEAQGQTSDPNALQGAGEIYLREGQVHRYSLLVALGQLLQIEELTQLQLEDAHVKYHIDPGVVTIDELLLTSPNIRLSARGTVSFGGQLDLDARLAINEQIRSRLFRAVRDNFQPTEMPDYTGVAFQVSGSLDRPRTNLVDRVVGEGLRDLSGVINSLFGRRKEKPAASAAPPENSPAPIEEFVPPATEEAAPPTASPTPTPSPSPAPGATP